MAAMPLGAFGRVCLRSNAQTDVRVELLAWAGPAPTPLTPTPPRRPSGESRSP